MKTKIPALATCAALTVTLAACGGASKDDSSGPSSAAASSPAAKSSPAAASSAPESSSPAASGSSAKGKTVELNKTVSDDAIGTKATFEKAVLGLPSPIASRQDDETFVLVKIKVQAGSKYYTSVLPGDFKLGIEGKEYSGENLTSNHSLVDFMNKNGYPPLKTTAQGQTQEGWIAGYLRDKDPKGGFVAYHRPEATTQDNKTLPAKIVHIPLAG